MPTALLYLFTLSRYFTGHPVREAGVLTSQISVDDAGELSPAFLKAVIVDNPNLSAHSGSK